MGGWGRSTQDGNMPFHGNSNDTSFEVGWRCETNPCGKEMQGHWLDSFSFKVQSVGIFSLTCKRMGRSESLG